MAGEIQLNSTTMATESSGTITLSNVNSATNRTNLGLGSMATQNANAVALTGGSLTGTEIDLKSSGTTIYKSDGTTAVLSESGGVVTLAQDIITGTSTYGFCRLGISSNQTTTGDITFNDPVGDTTNFTRSGVNITLGLSGIYFIVFSPTFLTNEQPERAVQASIRLSDDTELAVAYDQIEYLDSAESYSNASCSYVGHFNANDAIKFYFNSFSGGTSDIGGATHANIVLLRRTA